VNLTAHLTVHNRGAEINLDGELDDASVPLLRSLLNQACAAVSDLVVLRMHGLRVISAAGIRCLITAQQATGAELDMVFLGASPEVARKLRLAGISQRDALAS
jgi:anti-anti-sigma factor